MKESLQIRARKLYSPVEELTDVSVWIEDGVVQKVGVGTDPADRLLEAPLLAPGLIDLHINGSGGGDAAEGSYEALERMSRSLAQHGATGFLPTLITGAHEDLLAASSGLGDAWDRPLSGARPLGIHLEGPFLHPLRRGAHPKKYLQLPSRSLWDQVQKASGERVRMLTLAPELPGALDLIAGLREQIPIRSIGHSNATYDEAEAGIRTGANFATHVFNGMREIHHREPGIVGAVLSEEIDVEMIADGVHVHPAMVSMVAAIKGPDRLVLVTDAISAADMPDGIYELGSLKVTVENGVCRGAEGQLAGSTLTLDAALRNLIGWTRWPLGKCLQTMTLNPARLLGLQSCKGLIAEGADADLVLFSERLEVVATVVGGEVVWDKTMSRS